MGKRSRRFAAIIASVATFASMAVFTVSAKTKTVTYKPDGFGEKAVCGQFSFYYANSSDSGAVMSNPDANLIALDKVEASFAPQNGHAYKSSKDGDKTHHFFRLANGADIVWGQKGVINVMVFTAPEDGSYSYDIGTHCWSSMHTAIDVNLNGSWGEMVRPAQDVNTPATGTCDLKKGEKMYFLFRYLLENTEANPDGLTINSVSVTGTFSVEDDKPITGNKTVYKMDGYGEKVVCGQFSFSYAKADSAGAALSALVPLDKVETVFDPQNGKMYRSTGSDDRYHHFMKLANGDSCGFSQPGVYNVITFTAPADGEYTYNIQAHSWWNPDVVIDINHNGEWLPMVSVGTSNTVGESTVTMKKGEKIDFLFRTTAQGDTYAAYTINNVSVTGVTTSGGSPATADVTAAAAVIAIVSVAVIFTGKKRI